jgi:hypothetical protein
MPTEQPVSEQFLSILSERSVQLAWYASVAKAGYVQLPVLQMYWGRLALVDWPKLTMAWSTLALRMGLVAQAGESLD